MQWKVELHSALPLFSREQSDQPGKRLMGRLAQGRPGNSSISILGDRKYITFVVSDYKIELGNTSKLQRVMTTCTT